MASCNNPPPPYEPEPFTPAFGPTHAAPAATEQQINHQYAFSSYSEETLLIVKFGSERYQRLRFRFKALAGVLLVVVITSIIFAVQSINARVNAVRRAEQRIGLDLERMRKANLFWDQPSTQGRACSAWKTRTYSAKLHNIPGEVSGVNWCLKTPIDMPGFKFAQPEYCEEMKNGDVLGHWTLHDDKDCHTYWGRYNNLGCQDGLPGNRLIEMQLLDHHPPWNTGKQLCATTPWGDNGELPLICDDRGLWGFWGKWLVPDDTCSQSILVSEEVLAEQMG
ncbi:hypothetical protein CYLTODRAFT_420916 [Cylindrobasidium torrendii FP15055 ss-10]|uniref:Uncharacterized protein n=1 Tax=Cylindrobasidium torrendii FP15055 ss-10 TaxID=1314674 RepID=A0A0D7BHV3_9AGAR|nr:hypothetical protein CYLTODRAFT_420916 [Cylindrobasidium torrendii FP15055 ss-10]